MNKKDGFTLIELIVVMAIIAILIGLGIEGLLRFKSQVDLQTSGKQLITSLNLVKNSTKNDVRPSSNINFKGFEFKFDGVSSLNYLYSCSEVSAQVGGGNEWANCVSNEDFQNSIITSPLSLNLSNDVVAQVPRCSSVFFESLTGDILISSFDNLTARQSSCFVGFKDYNNRRTNYLYVDGIQDTFQIYFNEEDVINEFNSN